MILLTYSNELTKYIGGNKIMEVKQKVFNRAFAVGTITDYNKPVELKTMDNGAGWTGSTFDLGLNAVVSNNKNMQGLKFFGGMNIDKDTKKHKGFQIWENGEVKETIAYEDRNNPEILENVPFSKKRIFTNGDLKKEFLCEKEFVEYVHGEVKSLVGKRVYVTGEMEHSYSKGKVYKKMIVTRIDILAEEDTQLDKFDGSLQLYFTSEVIDQSIFSGSSVKFDAVQELAGEDNKIVLPVYVVTNNTDKATKKDIPKLFIPTEVVINTDKIDWTSPVHKKMVAFLLKSFRCPDAELVYTIGYNVKYYAGFNNKEYTEEEIMALFTEDEMEALEMGEMMDPGFKERAIKKKSGEVKGDKISETRLLCPNENFLVVEEALGITSAHLDLYKSIIKDKPETSKETKKEDKKKPENKITEPTDFAAVFG